MIKRILEKSISNKFLIEVLDWLITLSIATLVFLFVRVSVFQLAKVDGDSMLPTLKHNQYVFINKFKYKFKEPEYKDIVAFKSKINNMELFVKRIIGKENDIIDIKNGLFYINNQPLDDEFAESFVVNLGNITFPLTVPENSYFVLGDNRNNSLDSRYSDVGFVDKKDLLGSIKYRVFPFNVFGKIE